MNDQRPDIITCILTHNKDGMIQILRADPDAINAINPNGELNAPMMAVRRRLPEFIDAMIAEAGSKLDFAHHNARGDDLMTMATDTRDGPIIAAVQRAYKAYDPIFTQLPPEPDF